MERERSKNALVMWAILASLVSQSMVIPVMCRSLEGVGDEKNDYSHNLHSGSPKCSRSPSSPSHAAPPFRSSGGHSTPAFTPPSVNPSTPSTPATPSPDPQKPPYFTGTCDYWKTHPKLIWGVVGFWGTVAGVFGPTCIVAFGHDLNLQEALSNTRADGMGALFREGTASLLNSMVNSKFPFTTQQVRDKFAAAIVSDDAAATQAQLFRQANEGRLKPSA